LSAAVANARAADPASVVVLASGAYLPVAEAFAARVGADVVMGTPLEVHDGVATGRLAGPVQTGALKARAVRECLADATVLVAFGDTEADIPMLELAQSSVAVAPDSRLRRTALDRGWDVLETK